jgi:flagellar hook-associated protein 3 FlgL
LSGGVEDLVELQRDASGVTSLTVSRSVSPVAPTSLGSCALSGMPAITSTPANMNRAGDLLVQGGNDATDQTSRNAIATELGQIIEAIKQAASQSYRGSYVFSGTATSTRPYEQGADDTYHGDDGGLDPALPGIVREIGPGVTLTLNSVGKDILGQGQSAGDDKVLDVLRDAIDHLQSGDGASLRSTDLTRLDANVDHVLEVRAANGAKASRLDAAYSRLQQTEEATIGQLSTVEDADMAKTLIDLNSQTAAYQAALRAGANIVQSSLMDFLR